MTTHFSFRLPHAIRRGEWGARILLFTFCAAFLMSCGGSDDPEPEPEPEPTPVAPSVVSITPADGTQNLDGNIDITVVYDQIIVFKEADYVKIRATVGSITEAKAVQKELHITMVCGPGATIAVTIPAGVVTSTKEEHGAGLESRQHARQLRLVDWRPPAFRQVRDGLGTTRHRCPPLSGTESKGLWSHSRARHLVSAHAGRRHRR